MTSELHVFSNQEFGKVRSLMIDDEPWFVGRDAAKALGYSKPENALITHVDADDTLIQGIIDNMGRTQQTTIINESGLYSLIFSSKLPSAKRFKRWVTSEVLPALRKTGKYEVAPAPAVEVVPEHHLPQAGTVQAFDSPEFGRVRGLLFCGSAWFSGLDIVQGMGYSKHSCDCIRYHVSEENRYIASAREIPALGIDRRGSYIVSEEGVQELAKGSRYPLAKRFARWIRDEVAPAMRGEQPRLTAPERSELPEPRLNVPERKMVIDDYIRVASIVATCRNERLPYVLAYLKLGGIELPELPDIPKAEQPTNIAKPLIPAPVLVDEPHYISTIPEAHEIQTLLTEAHNRGFSDIKIAKKLGTHQTAVQRWRTGIYKPLADRIPVIRKGVTELLEQGA